MRLDVLTRLIDAADFMSFRELAAHCLALKGYVGVQNTDGWNDGGTDLRVFQLPPNPTGMAFQVTVERDWKKKLWEDAVKAKAKLNLDNLTLVSSHRIAEAEFFAEGEQIWRDHSVRVTKLDGPALASTFFMEGQSSVVLRILGIDAGTATADAPATARAKAAYAFAFFGKDVQTFRETAVESAIIGIMSERGPLDRAILERDARLLLNFQEDQAGRVTAAIDRMIQKGEVTGPATTLTLSDALADAASSMTILRGQDWLAFENGVRSLLHEAGVRVRANTVREVTAHVGSLLIDVAQNAVGALQSRGETFAGAAKQRLRTLHATLDTMGFPSSAARDEFLQQLARLAGSSPIGKCLLAGELFLSLLPTRTPQLIRALGGRSEIVTLLDASVAIPMLAGLLFRPVGNRFSVAAQHAYRQLNSHGLSIRLPLDYLEESASHLLRAYHDYGDIVDLDQDLVLSENAFVAHYASQRQAGEQMSFVQFLEGFGLNENLRQANFNVALEALKPRLQRFFSHYSIQAVPLYQPTYASQLRAEEGIAHALRELGVERPNILARHDARTLAYLFDSDKSGDIAHVFCTWDGVHFKVRQRETAAEWLVLNPALYGDILAMASEDTGPIATPEVLAKSLSEEAAERGAKVWDQIARIERGNLHDAELLNQARQFKESFVETAQGGQQAEAVRNAWAAWRAQHYVPRDEQPKIDGANQ